MTLNGLRRSYISANAGFNPRARETPAAYLPLIRSLQFPALSVLQCSMRFYGKTICCKWLLQLEILSCDMFYIILIHFAFLYKSVFLPVTHTIYRIIRL